ncbi:MAG TPA: NFACT family protein, partial [Longimicrobiales bacterium]
MIRYDSLLVHYLALELDELLAGAGASTLRLDPASRVAALETTAGTLVLDLHPSSGIITLGAAPAAAVVLALHRRSVVARVTSPADERILTIELAGAPATRVRRVVVELMGNQWNVLAVDGEDRIVQVLRAREAGGRKLRPGVAYEPPPASTRAGLDRPLSIEEWTELLEPLAPAERERALVANVAWTSPLNAPLILAEPPAGSGVDALDLACGTYWYLTGFPPAHPCVLTLPVGEQPYPQPFPQVAARPTRSLLEAMALAGGLPAQAPGRSASLLSPELLERARRRLRVLEARARRLEAQGAGAREEALALRAQADVLLANLGAMRKGARRVTLPDFAGGEIEVELDP